MSHWSPGQLSIITTAMMGCTSGRKVTRLNINILNFKSQREHKGIKSENLTLRHFQASKVSIKCLLVMWYFVFLYSMAVLVNLIINNMFYGDFSVIELSTIIQIYFRVLPCVSFLTFSHFNGHKDNMF